MIKSSIQIHQNRHNELPTDWRWAYVSEVCERIDYGFTASANFSISEPRFLRITDIQNGLVNWENVPGCTISPMEETANLLTDGDIVFARTGGTTGKSFLIKQPPRAVFASYLIRLKPNNQVTSEYLYAFFQSPFYWQQVKASARGGAQPNVNATLLGQIRFPLPPLPEQRHIAAILAEQMADVERALMAVETELEASEKLPAAYLQKVFDERHTYEWPEFRLGDVAEIGSGITLGPRLNKTPAKRLPYLRVANVKDGHLDLSDVYTIEATQSEIEKCTLKFGDILLTEGGDPDKLGRGTFWQNEIPQCLHQNHIFRVRFDLQRFSPTFVSLQIASPYGKGYFLAHAKQTTGIATINQKVLANFPLMVPPFDEQERIALILSENMETSKSIIALLKEKLYALSEIPTILLKEAFAGRV